MAVYVNQMNPQEIVIAGRNANGDIVEMGTASVAYTVTAGAEVATLTITAKPGATLTGTALSFS